MSMCVDELSLQRVLDRTKRLAREGMRQNVWKVAAAVQYMDNLLSRMHDSDIDADVMLQYGREIRSLKLMVEAEHKKGAEEKLQQLDRIPHRFPDIAALDKTQHDVARPVSAAGQVDSVLNESSAGVRARTRAFYKADLRRQLLGEAEKERAGGREGGGEEAERARHEQRHEALAEDLLGLTRSLKRNMTVAGGVIKDDNKRLGVMGAQVDANRERLSNEGTRLAKHAYKCGLDCCLIGVAVFIFWSFVAMVILMKVFPKPKTA